VAARIGFGLLGFLVVLPGIAAIAGAFALGSTSDTVAGTLSVGINPCSSPSAWCGSWWRPWCSPP